MASRRHHHAHHQANDGPPSYGRPGYRDRSGRSGLDPMDTYREEGSVAGLFIRNLFTGHVRTRNPVLLILMTLIGITCLAPEVLAVVYRINDGGAISICVGPPMGIIGLGFIANVTLSLFGHQ